jgi:hypothetical protein
MSMDMENTENSNPEINNETPDNPDDDLVLEFRDSVHWGCGIFSVILVYFAGVLILFKRDLIIQFLSFFEISNLTIVFDSLMKNYGITALVTIIIAIITGLYLYLRFFSNIRHNEFSDDMSKYLEFYETLFSTSFDVTLLGILFLYLIFIKQSFWEFVIAFLVISGLAFSIWKISIPYSKTIRDYSGMERMNQYLDTIQKKSGKELLSDVEESISDLTFYGFVRKNSVWTIGALFLTIIFAFYCISGEFNILTIILLELMVIRYALFQSQIGSLPHIPVNFYLSSGEIYNRVYMIRESRDVLIILTPSDTMFLVMKSQIKMVEPIIESINPG